MERKKTTKDIDILEGPLLVFGGVYSNLQALEKMQAIANDLAILPSQIICTGDVVGYCAQPEECVQAIKAWDVHVIAGNVEIQLREDEADCGCNFKEGGRCDLFSRQWFPYSKARLSESSIDWMHQLPDFIHFRYAGLSGLVVHGSYHHTSEYVFASTPWATKQQNFADTGADLILAGHCGLPFSQERDQKKWLNPGVIGMPANDGRTQVWYMLLDNLSERSIRHAHRSFDYDHETAARLMETHGLPREYAHTLRTGVWDNCEILPEREKREQGLALVF